MPASNHTRPVRPDHGRDGRIARQLEEDIVLGLLKPNERLVENDLMSRFNETRYNVRNALRHLQSLGIVTTVRNRGTIVRDFSTQDVEDIQEVGGLLLQHLAQTLPLPPPADLAVELRSLVKAQKAASALGDQVTVYRLGKQFRARLLSGCRNRLLVDAVERYWCQWQCIFRNGVPGQTYPLIFQWHMLLLRAVARSDRKQLVRICSECQRPISSGNRLHQPSPMDHVSNQCVT